MRSSVVIALVLAIPVGAFAPRPVRPPVAVRRMTTEAPEEIAVVAEEEPAPVPPAAPRRSPALPFMDAPVVLDGSLAGDAGFDPVGFADCRENLLLYREAEIKHARLAMLAAAGWPLSELFQPKLAATLGAQSLLSDAGRSPSVLNGGLGQGPVTVFVLAAFAATAAVELATLNAQYLNPEDFAKRETVFAAKEKEGLTPGIFGFDPLGLYTFFGPNEAGKKAMQTAEIKNGRLAMLGITGFAIQEAIFRAPVIAQTPAFFKVNATILASLATLTSPLIWTLPASHSGKWSPTS